MTTDVVVHEAQGLALSPEQAEFTDMQVSILKQLGVKDATRGDLAVFHHVCQRTGLDPFAKQIYMLGRWTKDGTKQTIQTGIDGYRLVARRAADKAGESLEYEDTLWCGQDGAWVDVWLHDQPPAAAKVTVLRNGNRFPAVAKWSEYVQTTKNGEATAMWARMSANQLAKCAEAAALRKAFPQDLSGVYTDDEMGQAQRPQAPEHRPAADRIRAIVEPQPDVRSQDQSDCIHTLLGLVNIDTREGKLKFCSDVLQRDVDSTTTLTVGEASKVIDALQARLDDSGDAA
jgi:phage recombination protein Bet